MKLKTILTYAAIAFALRWVIQQPTESAHVEQHAASLLATVFRGIRNFFASI
jgi:hypothetical protein